jgi:hypothetical protein
MGTVAVVIGLVRGPVARWRCRAVMVRTGGMSSGVIVVGGVCVGADHLRHHKGKRNHGR